MTLAQKDKAFIWHPYTAQAGEEAPIVVERAEGAWLYTSDGTRILDAISSWWVNLHGHGHPYIAQKIAEQARRLEHVIFAGFTHPPAVQLAEQILELLPENFSKVFFSDNGSTCVEVALKMAVQYWYNQGRRKTKIIALENAYHGDTFGAMSAGGRSLFTAAFEPLLFEVEYLPLPGAGTIEQCKQKLLQAAAKDTVAAFIFEPLLQGAAGMQMYEPEYLDELIRIAHQHEVLCIADEVLTGFGRTGKTLACDYLQEVPDIICLSKGITGGFLPLGLTVCSEKIYQAFYSNADEKTFFHGHSYTANPLACAAALASLELLQSPATLASMERISSSHHRFLQEVKGSCALKDIRHRGTILALEFRTPQKSSYFNHLRRELYTLALSEGVLLRPLGNTLYLLPPYCITEEELELCYHLLRRILRKLEGK